MAEETRLQSQSTGEVFTGARPPVAAPVRRAAKRREGPFVKYVGEASKRVIRPHHWRSTKNVGHEGTRDHSEIHTWDLNNDKLVPASKFSDEQLDYLLCDDMQQKGGHSFLLVDHDDDGNLVQVSR